MRIYLAGPMRGLPHFNDTAFDKAAAELRAKGHEVFSPVEHTRKLYGEDIFKNNIEGNEDKAGIDGQLVFSDDLDWICNHADAIAMLKGWRKSRGARCEWAAAVALDKAIIYLDETIEPKEAYIATVTGDLVGQRYITLAARSGEYERWALDDDLLKKLRREINQKLD